MIRRVSTTVLAAVLAIAVGAAPVAADLESNLATLSPDQVRGYLGPFHKAMSATMNSGIFRTGEVPRSGFNFTLDLKASYSSFSDESRTYSADSFSGYPEADVPTVVGNTQTVDVVNETNSSLVYSHPGGFNMDNFATAFPQLSIGSVLGTRAIFRYITLQLGDEDLGDFELIGVGLQHSITQYLPGIEPMQLAVGGMWQQFKVGSQDLVKTETISLNLTASRKFGAVVNFEPYVGLGYDTATMESNYDDGTGTTVNTEFDRTNDFRIAVGGNLNFPLVMLHAEYYAAAEQGIAGGISLGI